ncbi:MAG: cysteine hydrolase [Acidobacteria bacterium]|nr:cysteine hydrolase [Acidobacteriota bacterium]
MREPALVLIDMQRAVDDASWGERNNVQAEANARALLERWRARVGMIVHVRHDSTGPNSTYRPGQPGHEFKPETAPLSGEIIVAKSVNSAFIGTGLEQLLRSAGITELVVCGVCTNNSVETTVRHGANLGFRITLVEDACFTFGRTDYHGRARTADEVHAMSLANLEGEYCRVARTAEWGEG